MKTVAQLTQHSRPQVGQRTILPHPDPLPLGEGTAIAPRNCFITCPANAGAGYSKNRTAILPLLAGEGRGEGETPDHGRASAALGRFADAARIPCLAMILLAGCAVGPDYQRPALYPPGEYRTAASDTNAPAGTNSFADLGWWAVFQDPQLTAYIGDALTNN